eukprot:CAMPEP_0181127868 /NCGR_PEP_ID=MMETSP1071-20121207/28435_1 /TAXON_ID=35127 /ORGANISM="Thalassiosira sp., Strain NH16" /LENGTH=76 /DNA_ID=CAMNT_0023213651 /DNA_START=748 /DNA_END=978 /DNA_ORIENTATION=-
MDEGTRNRLGADTDDPPAADRSYSRDNSASALDAAPITPRSSPNNSAATCVKGRSVPPAKTIACASSTTLSKLEAE